MTPSGENSQRILIFCGDGEEFVVLLPHTMQKAAVTAVEKWLAKLKATPITVMDGAIIHISFSAGVATCTPQGNYASAKDAAEALLRLADHRLYTAKEDGRCRVSGGTPRDSAVS